MGRYQVNLTLGEQLRAAIRYTAMRDGIAPSTKIRQILTQQLARTIASAEFQQHLKDVADIDANIDRSINGQQ